MEAQLVEDSAVDAVVVDNDAIEKDYKERLQEDTSRVRKMFLIGGVLLLVAVIAIVVGTVVGLQNNSSNSVGNGVTSPECSVDLTITCSSDDNARNDNARTDCVDLMPPDACQGPPTFLAFTYNGKDCNSSTTVETPGVFECTDFNGGPATLQEKAALIVVTEPGGNMVDTE
jgi:hypothetical protein